ncbi:hypothetical protein Tsp_11216 [Trichinella spiralis]|uniref:hypothetical protein n=1 Tax=Trichinella spiralis TaxID=6334 RepID=UPI0001EFEEBD|nr:hypothetical protein Tsp_11216 [Trichinella spiralis]
MNARAYADGRGRRLAGGFADRRVGSEVGQSHARGAHTGRRGNRRPFPHSPENCRHRTLWRNLGTIRNTENRDRVEDRRRNQRRQRPVGQFEIGHQRARRLLDRAHRHGADDHHGPGRGRRAQRPFQATTLLLLSRRQALSGERRRRADQQPGRCDRSGQQ